MKLFDTHCHLSGKTLRDRAPALLENVKNSVVGALCLISTSDEDLEATADCATHWQKQFPEIKICHSVGIHPHDAQNCTDEVFSKVEQLSGKANAIGETGLDFFYDFSDRQTQHDVFAKHIDLAIRTQKPLVIHCRNSATEILDQLEAAAIHKKSARPGILHCFTESWAIAERCLDLGLMISFSGILTFKNASELRDTAAKIPLDRLLIETDSPYLAPIPHRGKDNEPAFVEKTFDMLASIRKESKEDLGHALWQNSCRIFGIEPNHVI